MEINIRKRRRRRDIFDAPAPPVRTDCAEGGAERGGGSLDRDCVVVN